MSFKWAGRFKELLHGRTDGPSIADSKGALPCTVDPALVGSYLRGGANLIGSGACLDDWFSGKKAVALRDVFWDGEWLWFADLPYYVEHYLVAIPEEFLARMEAYSWICPGPSREQQEQVRQVQLADVESR